MEKEDIVQNILSHATGTASYHKYSTFPFYPVITDGVKAIAEAAGCYWLLDIIGSYQQNKKLDPYFQAWKLTVNEDDSAVVNGYNDTTLTITQKVEYTDFPLDEIELFLIDGVILLPSEY